MEEIYRQTFRVVRDAAGSVLRQAADRDDVVHEVYLELMSSRPLRESHRGGKLSAWLGAIARHRAMDFARRHGRLIGLAAIERVTQENGSLDDFRRELARFTARLDPPRRRLMELRYIAGLTQMEAAAALGMSRSTLEDWERRLKQALHAFLASNAAAG